MRRLALLMTWVGVTLVLTSAAAVFLSKYAQWQERRAWSELHPSPTEDVSKSSKRSKKRPLSSGHVKTQATAETGPAFARLYFPRLEREVFVYEGDTESNLSKGPAWLPTTGVPGQAGNSVIAGHRDTHFRFLKDVRKGDEITLHVPPNLFRYRIRSLQVVEPSNVRLLAPDSRPVLTLVTCYPFTFVGLAPRRFIVRAELVYEILAKQHSK
jgi:sortase A